MTLRISCLYTKYGIASIAIAPSLLSRARSADMAAWPVRRVDRFSGAAQMLDDDGDEIGDAERVTLHQGFIAKLGGDLCAEPGCPLGSCATGDWRFVSSSTPRRILRGRESAPPASVRPRRRRADQRRPAPTDQGARAGSCSANTAECPGVRGGAAPKGRKGWPGKPPDRRCRDRRQRPPSRFPSIRADGAHPSQILGFIERKRTHQPSWATQELRTETEKSTAIDPSPSRRKRPSAREG
jgi:hypothetical protein